MTDTTTATDIVLAPDGTEVDRRSVLLWEIGAFFFIMLAASALHFAFELSNFSEPLAVFASVNESTFEHLKLFFWPALIYALVQHAYTKGTVNNYWFGKGMAMVATPLGIIASFYLYLGILLPIRGSGLLAFDIGTGAVGVLLGNFVAYRLLTSPDRGRTYRNLGIAAIAILAVLMATAAWIQPPFFLYEDFFGYEYTGQFGIREDY
ncbi:MAG: DUF6512 family protein, partial [Acidimicrobiia bacterium]